MSGASLDGRVFDLVSSTASAVDPEHRTRFAYHEGDGVVWGEYSGGVVTTGRFVGVRTDDRLDVRFVHSLAAGGPPVAGEAASRIEQDGQRLRLVEDFAVDGVAHRSVCVERVDPKQPE